MRHSQRRYPIPEVARRDLNIWHVIQYSHYSILATIKPIFKLGTLRDPDVGPVQGRNPLGLRFLRSFRLARTVEGDRFADECLEGGLVNFFSFVDVDRAASVSVETRVEETGRIL